MRREAAARLPDEFQRLHPQVPWSGAATLRNRIVHEYWDLDREVIWGTIQSDLPGIRDQVAKILKVEFPDEFS
jgi:uncharacterized protein with HEPN domain